MAQEIERKFLVAGDYKSEAYTSVRITQGYLSRVPERVVRVRIKGDKGFITIKGTTNDTGLSRFEWEKEIPLAETQSLLKLAEPGVIDKTRHLIKNTDGRHIWEVDEFHGDNEGLVMAEIELESENDLFDKPSWLGKEVTGDKRYYNAYLSENPYKTW
ncbi:MAG: CYTH domain-containing protein [Bacteroidales bacterium]|nr:CYTH domain-containing protein [Bacteroidales bacterium]